MKQASLGEIALHLGINKSKLAYFFSVGLIEPIAKVGKMNLFEEKNTLKILAKIDDLKSKGKSLKEIKILLYK